MNDSSLSVEDSYRTLSKVDAKLVELTRAVEVLKGQVHSRSIKIGVSSAVTADLLNIYLQRHGLLHGVDMECLPGNYDDPVGDVERFRQAGVQQLVLLPFFDNLLPSFEAQLEGLEPSQVDDKEAEFRSRYRLAFEQARHFDAIYLCTFHRLGTPASAGAHDAVALVLERFNVALREEAAPYANIRVIDTQAIVRHIGQNGAFDARFYFRNKAPYTGAFMNELASRIAASARGFGGYFYKVLALDCDNTLWGGVVGEDLVSGIKLGPYDYPDNIFWRMQHEFSALEKQGVLLALVTKNNPEDIEEVFRTHPDMVLRESQIVIKKANWDDKPSNLRALAEELNVGLDSIVFLDDSSFECEAVRQQLPMVKTVQVPATLSEFPRVVAQIKALFLAGGIAADSKSKTEHYRQRAGAQALEAQFDNQQAYLASLGLKVELSRNARASTARISELSQKSNQFNLTSRRYSVAEIERLMDNPSSAVYSLVVIDKFGNAGLTGVATVRYEGEVACIDNFFMSCRVIGRGVETSIWARIAADAGRQGCTELHAQFIATAKNAQVADFYDRLGLPVVSDINGGERQYAIAIADFAATENSWIEMIYVE